MSDLRLRLIRAGALVTAVILAAVIGYMALLNLSFLDSLYLTIVTVATVGYGDLSPHLNMPVGGSPWVTKGFGMMVIVVGMAAMAYTLGVATEFIVSGEWRRARKEKELRKKIDNLSDHFILCGTGEPVMKMAAELTLTQRTCLFIDKDETRLNELEKTHPNILRMLGDATEEEALELAGVERCSGVVAALPDHKDNLLITLAAASHRNESHRFRLVARAKDYLKSGSKLLSAGADAVVAPDYIAGRRMVAEMLHPATTSFMGSMFVDTRGVVRFEEGEVTSEFVVAGKTLAELDIPGKQGIQIIAIERDNNFIFNPGSQERLCKGDCCVIIADVAVVNDFKDLLAGDES